MQYLPRAGVLLATNIEQNIVQHSAVSLDLEVSEPPL